MWEQVKIVAIHTQTQTANNDWNYVEKRVIVKCWLWTAWTISWTNHNALTVNFKILFKRKQQKFKAVFKNSRCKCHPAALKSMTVITKKVAKALLTCPVWIIMQSVQVCVKCVVLPAEHQDVVESRVLFQRCQLLKAQLFAAPIKAIRAVYANVVVIATGAILHRAQTRWTLRKKKWINKNYF